MLTPTNHCAAPAAPSATAAADTDIPLRDLVCRHARELEGLLAAHLQHTAPALAPAFGQQLEACRKLGGTKFSSWLYGVTLRLLRDSLAKGFAEPSDFALRFLRGFPQSLARPMITLALSSISYVACSIYLCKPACAAPQDISLPSDWKACLDRNLR
ncbi:hypothetical protein [Achromobacter agilis]|uniref:Uncharacterized protein n=1 Tax=Achromobacter agilis TaxID=1353888 RepID=A0A446CFY3_9BURK|nr:hypothetical protein [Achromobacter agilis]SSW66804.1 hypothetical protein AGI3411_02734 [Achromobacter agilis]